MSSSNPQPPAQAPASPTPAPPQPVASGRLAGRTRWALIGFAIILAVVAGFFVIHWIVFRATNSITEDAFVEAHIVNVAAQMVSGRLVRFLVEENDHVQQGQVLAQIDPIHYRDQVDQARGKLDLAEAELNRQKAGLAKLNKEVPVQIAIAEKTLAASRIEAAKAEETLKLTTDEVNKTIEEARAALAVAQANETLAKLEFDRWTKLADQDAATKQKSDTVTQTFHAAGADGRLADARLAKAEAARTRIVIAKQDLEAAQILVAKAARSLELAQTGYDEIREVELMVGVKQEVVKDAQIALQTAQHQFEFTQLRAPFPGVVVKRYRHLGDFASPGVAVLSMYNPDLLYVTANLPETRLRGVAPGNPVELHLTAFTEPFHGRVVWLNKSTGAEFALMPRNVVSGEFTWVVQRVPVRIAIDKDDRWPLLRAGLSVRAAIEHGVGDPQWAAQAAREMADLEERYNRAKE